MASPLESSASFPAYVGAALFDALTGRSLGEQAEALAEHYDLVVPPFGTAPTAETGDLLITRAFAEGGVAEIAYCSERPELFGGQLGANQIIVRPTAGAAAGRGEAGPVDAVLPGESDDGMSEVAPAFIAVAGTVISAAELGLGVFDRLEKHLLSGSFSVASQAASYIHDPSPSALVSQTRKFRFKLVGGHKWPVSNQQFHFVVTLEYDGFNIRRASIVEDRGKSSDLYGSDFDIAFTPSRFSAVNEPETKIVYNIQGRWNPIGRGDESFDGRFIIDSQGGLTGLSINAPQRYVWIDGPVTAEGGGKVPSRRLHRFLTNVHFDKPGSTKLTQGNIRHLHGWATGLPAAVRKEMAAGALPLLVTGRASTTGTVQQNQAIARARAVAVGKVIGDVIGSGTRIEIRVAGELEARTPDKVENADERRCDLDISVTEYALP